MVKVEIDIIINVDHKRVFEFIANFENNPIWQNGMVSCNYTFRTDEVIGSTYDQLARFGGRDIVTKFLVTQYEENSIIKAMSTEGSFPITFTRQVASIEEGTRVQALIEGDSSGFFRILNPIMQFMVSRSINKDYKQLKHYLEHQDRNK